MPTFVTDDPRDREIAELRRQRNALRSAAADLIDVYDLLTDNGYAYNRPICFGNQPIANLRKAIREAGQS